LNAQKWTSEARLNLALSEGGGLWEVDLRTMTIQISANFSRMLQLPEAFPATVEAWLRLVHPEDRRRMVRASQSVAAGEQSKVQDIYRLRDAEGQYHWMQTRARILRDGAGRPR